jgi:cell division protein DivIC
LGCTGKSTPKQRQPALKNVACAFARTFIWPSFSRMNPSKLVNGFFAVLFTAIVLWAVAFFVGMHRELKALQAQEEVNRARLAAAEEKLREQTEYLERLRQDPALLERIIREKLGYAKNDEYIFRFEDTPKK